MTTTSGTFRHDNHAARLAAAGDGLHLRGLSGRVWASALAGHARRRPRRLT